MKELKILLRCFSSAQKREQKAIIKKLWMLHYLQNEDRNYSRDYQIDPFPGQIDENVYNME